MTKKAKKYIDNKIEKAKTNFEERKERIINETNLNELFDKYNNFKNLVNQTTGLKDKIRENVRKSIYNMMPRKRTSVTHSKYHHKTGLTFRDGTAYIYNTKRDRKPTMSKLINYKSDIKYEIDDDYNEEFENLFNVINNINFNKLDHKQEFSYNGIKYITVLQTKRSGGYRKIQLEKKSTAKSKNKYLINSVIFRESYSRVINLMEKKEIIEKAIDIFSETVKDVKSERKSILNDINNAVGHLVAINEIEKMT